MCSSKLKEKPHTSQVKSFVWACMVDVTLRRDTSGMFQAETCEPDAWMDCHDGFRAAQDTL